jgi:hypothetical protein
MVSTPLPVKSRYTRALSSRIANVPSTDLDTSFPTL